MELVPILSTIILVGTIATFILAVAAYILYKIRERRSGREYAPEERRREEPHVLVEPARRGTGRETGREIGSGAGRGMERNESLFWEYTDEGFVPVRTVDEAGSGAASGRETGHDDPDRSESRRLDSNRAAWT